MREREDYEAAYLEVPAEFKADGPASFEESLERVAQLDAVEFTGDTAETVKLSQIDTNDAALRTAWDAVLGVCGYVRARADGAWQQGLGQYL